ncbi:MAG: D-alanyl-D-alanine carboxypeptidase [Planctomycetes bacterium]|nr:D-alanyl-D-alanine carboxypeptidase [Planctomycetota bacterium]
MSKLQGPKLNRRQFFQFAGTGALAFAFADRLDAQQPLPARRPADAPDGPPIVSARAWAIFDGRTGRRLHGHNDATALPMASTTKIMTAWVVLQQAVNNPKVLDEIVNVSAQAAKTPGSSARIQAGDRIPVRDMLYGLLLPSGNNAALALAEHFGPRLRDPKGKTPALAAFLAEMNRLAARLKLGETRYIDPHGLGRNLTSARDLCMLGFTAMQNATFRQYVQTRRHQTQITNGKNERRKMIWNNTNKLLDIEGYNGIKTGTTTAAGSCLVASGQRGPSQLIVTVLGCTSNDSRYVDTRNLFRWAWRERR